MIGRADWPVTTDEFWQYAVTSEEQVVPHALCNVICCLTLLDMLLFQSLGLFGCSYRQAVYHVDIKKR
jgi:hypothetical protein